MPHLVDENILMGMGMAFDRMEPFGPKSCLVRHGKKWENHFILLFGWNILCQNGNEL